MSTTDGNVVINWMNGVFAMMGAMYVLVVAWAITGLVAFIWSLVCMGRTPSMGKAIVGIVLAVLFGPFYFIYYAMDKDYCRGDGKTAAKIED